MSPEELQKTAEELKHYAVALTSIAEKLGAGTTVKKKKKGGLTEAEMEAHKEKFIKSLYR